MQWLVAFVCTIWSELQAHLLYDKNPSLQINTPFTALIYHWKPVEPLYTWNFTSLLQDLSKHSSDFNNDLNYRNLLAPGIWGCNLKNMIIKFIRQNSNFQGHLLCSCSPINVIILHWRLVNIGSGNGLVPLGNKPLPDPMLAQIYFTM